MPQNYHLAAAWYRKAADHGHAYGEFHLGVCYERGQGAPQDHQLAAAWYRKAAEQGHAHAQCNLGIMYHQGKGVSQDYHSAVEWYLKAAKQGIAIAQFNLGLLYETGKGVPQDYKFAAAWYGRAADQGDADAKARAQQSQRSDREQQQETAFEWWVVLGTEPDASFEAARRAYRLKMKHYHPDTLVGLGPEFLELAEKKSRVLNAAIEEVERCRRASGRERGVTEPLLAPQKDP